MTDERAVPIWHEALEARVSASMEHIAQELGETEKKINHVLHIMENLEVAPVEPDRTELYAAFVKAQDEIKNATVNVINDFTHKKYADLSSVMDAVRKPLAANGLAIMQFTADESQSILGIRTLLVHESGQSIEDVITMSPPKLDPQGVGSCRTYMRRYAVLALIGIAGAVDDDAEGSNKDPNDYPRITPGEVDKVLYHAEEVLGERADEVVKRMLKGVFSGASCVGDIREGQSAAAIQAIDNAKKLIDKKAAKAKKDEAVERKEAKEAK